MTDPYQEATRHERTGLSTVAKVFLIGGGLLVAVVIALVVWVTVTVDRWMDDIVKAADYSLEVPPDVITAGTSGVRAATNELPEQQLPEGAARDLSVGSLLAGLTASGLDAILTEHGFSATAGEDPGLALNLETPNGNPVGLSFPRATEILDRVARGEARFADADLGSAVGKMPDWVPVHPGAGHSGSGLYARGDVSLGVTVLVADMGAEDVLDWYREAADRAGLRGVSVVRTSATVKVDGEPEAGRIDAHRFIAKSKDRSLMVLATEDDHGGSLFVVAYRG